MQLAFASSAFRRYPLVEAFDEIARAGYPAVEIMCDAPHAYPEQLSTADRADIRRALRDRGLATPIIVMTAAQDAVGWAAEIDAAGVLSKPFDLLDLLDVVERLYRPRAA